MSQNQIEKTSYLKKKSIWNERSTRNEDIVMTTSPLGVYFMLTTAVAFLTQKQC